MDHLGWNATAIYSTLYKYWWDCTFLFLSRCPSSIVLFVIRNFSTSHNLTGCILTARNSRPLCSSCRLVCQKTAPITSRRRGHEYIYSCCRMLKYAEEFYLQVDCVAHKVRVAVSKRWLSRRTDSLRHTGIDRSRRTCRLREGTRQGLHFLEPRYLKVYFSWLPLLIAYFRHLLTSFDESEYGTWLFPTGLLLCNHS
jgi:hypothetical protein